MNRDEFLIKDLPDPEAARRFLDDLSKLHTQRYTKLVRQEGLLSDVLTLASYSPLLAATLLQNPPYIDWLGRRRADGGSRSKDELLESLARFSLTNSQADVQVLLARFRRRELLRIFLRDIRRLATIAEITEEISNLADAILEHALRIARQELENRFGMPLETDDKGRSKPAGFCIVSLGKLGSRELNYSSDIDLLFIYSADGMTAATGTRNAISNREFSIKLSERVAKLVGEQTGEGSAYRVDLRLRPHGRIGPLALSINETARYYLAEARPWERQVMIRSRPSAGDGELYRSFFSKIESVVFSTARSIEEALENVRQSKEQIDRELKPGHGLNVKLGRGGIREIEFIAQALQLAYGGRDRWVRSSHTLISLSRLADRGLITSAELTDLFDAYDFLRRLEHILQMEHGLQTHILPDDRDRRELIAAKMNAADPNAFEILLDKHTKNVSGVFDRIFKGGGPAAPVGIPAAGRSDGAGLSQRKNPPKDELLDFISANSPRFAVLAASEPDVIEEIRNTPRQTVILDQTPLFAEAVGSAASNFRDALDAMRRIWHKAILRIAVRDLLGEVSIADAKSAQTALAESSIDAAFAIAAREMANRLSIAAEPLAMASLALGKLGGGGVDYDSDLDLVLVNDDEMPLAADGLKPAEFFGRAAELFVNALSGMTREGSLYRIDMRLRPHGKNGPSTMSVRTLSEYMKGEAAIWELLAYVKLRGAGGDRGLAHNAESSVREIVRSRSAALDPDTLRRETLRVRLRLEKERAGRLKPNEVDIKYGQGGLLDIYFATRFLQLRDDVPDTPESRATGSILEKLRKKGSIDQQVFHAFSSGYAFLADLDHYIRLTIGRNTRVPFTRPEIMKLIAGRMKIENAGDIIERLTLHRIEIRQAFEDVLRG